MAIWNDIGDFVHDTWDEVSGITRTNIGKAGKAALHGDLTEAEKEYEKGIVRAIAPYKKASGNEIRNKYRKKINSTISATIKSTNSVSNELDKDISGQFSDKIKTTITALNGEEGGQVGGLNSIIE